MTNKNYGWLIRVPTHFGVGLYKEMNLSNLPITKLCRKLDTEYYYISSVLLRFEKEKLIQTSMFNKRAKSIKLTPKGEKVFSLMSALLTELKINDGKEN